MDTTTKPADVAAKSAARCSGLNRFVLLICSFLSVMVTASCTTGPARNAQKGSANAELMGGVSWDPAKTFALVIGVIEWLDTSSFERFDRERRQDRAFYAQLKARGVPPSQILYLEDRRATLSNVRQSFQSLLSEAPEHSTFIFYFSGHGDQDAGQTCFATYDVDGDHMSMSGLTVPEITKTLQQEWKGGTLLLFADSCQSGSLDEVVQAFEGSDVRAASLSSAAPEWNSSGNTFAQSLVGVFGGDGIVDLNGDRCITFAEARTFVHREVLWKEGEPSGASRTSNFNPDFIFASVDPALEVPHLDGPYQIGDYVTVAIDEKRRMARIDAFDQGQYEVSFLDEHTSHRPARPSFLTRLVNSVLVFTKRSADQPDVGQEQPAWVTLDQLSSPAFESPAAVGDAVDVESDNGYWHRGVVVAINDDHFCKVTFRPEDWPDEWIFRGCLCKASDEEP